VQGNGDPFDSGDVGDMRRARMEAPMETGKGVRSWRRIEAAERRGEQIRYVNRVWRMALAGRRRLPLSWLRLIHDEWQRGVYSASERRYNDEC
jgi:hypothetical protein